MKVALYIGDHTKDDWLTRLGWWATRAVQKGEFWRVTHVEAIHDEATDGSITIASASIREGSLRTGSKNGVRTKSGVVLSPGNWSIVDVPQWGVERSVEWFDKHDGELYDTRGAFASAMPIQWNQPNRWFCNQAVGAAGGLIEPQVFGPSQFAAIVFTIGYDVTKPFFESRENEVPKT